MVTVRQVRAQLSRSRSFLERALHASDAETWHDCLLAGVYFAQSAIEFMRETAKEGGLKVDLRRFDAIVAELAPRSRLLRGLRVRDFHRAPVQGLGFAQLEHSIRMPPLGTATIHFNPSPRGPSVSVEVSDGSKNYTFFFVGHGFVQDHLEHSSIRLTIYCLSSFNALTAVLKNSPNSIGDPMLPNKRLKLTARVD